MKAMRPALGLALAFGLAGAACAALLAGCGVVSTPADTPAATKESLPSGRELAPEGTQVTLGNFPTGGAVTADGRFLWTVSSGFDYNDIRIVDTATQQVIKTIPVTSATGGIALDSEHRLAYVSGVLLSRWQPSRESLPGAGLPGADLGNCILVYTWDADTGQASFLRVIPVPPQPGALIVQSYPAPGYPDSWPQDLAVSPDGSQLLVPLNLADSAAVID